MIPKRRGLGSNNNGYKEARDRRLRAEEDRRIRDEKQSLALAHYGFLETKRKEIWAAEIYVYGHIRRQGICSSHHDELNQSHQEASRAYNHCIAMGCSKEQMRRALVRAAVRRQDKKGQV
jgi:hypothetical protein